MFASYEVARIGAEDFSQLYVNRNRSATAAQVPKLRSQGYSALIVTVDSAVPGNRERDQRAKGDEFVAPAGWKNQGGGGGAGIALAISGYQDPDVAWEDIPWIRSLTDLPLYVKGIQCVEVGAGLSDQHASGLSKCHRMLLRRLRCSRCRASFFQTTGDGHWTSKCFSFAWTRLHCTDRAACTQCASPDDDLARAASGAA